MIWSVTRKFQTKNRDDRRHCTDGPAVPSSRASKGGS
jgi:hypothetical protein